MKEQYLKVYDLHNERYEQPNRHQYRGGGDDYFLYLERLEKYYGQLLPSWEFYVGRKEDDEMKANLFLLLYDSATDSYEIHIWNTLHPEDNQIDGLFCGHRLVPSYFGLEDEEDVLKWLIGSFSESTYLRGYQGDEIKRIVRCLDDEVFYSATNS